MRVFTRDGTPVEITVGGSESDDIMITSAEFIGESRSGYSYRGRNVMDTDIEWIENKFAGEIYEQWLDDRIGDAEDRCDMER